MGQAALLMDYAALAPVESTSLGEQVADRIVGAIAARKLGPGERLIETDLARELQVSRVPIREAMRVLESQGILQASHRRGMRVIGFDAAWNGQLYETRVALEQQVAQIAARKLREDVTAGARLDAVLQQMRRMMAAEDRLGVNHADLAFHRTLCTLAASPLLTSLWSAIARHVLIKFSFETADHPDLRLIYDQHMALKRLLLEGSVEAIAEEVPRHVAGAETMFAERDRYQAC